MTQAETHMRKAHIIASSWTWTGSVLLRGVLFLASVISWLFCLAFCPPARTWLSCRLIVWWKIWLKLRYALCSSSHAINRLMPWKLRLIPELMDHGSWNFHVTSRGLAILEVCFLRITFILSLSHDICSEFELHAICFQPPSLLFNISSQYDLPFPMWRDG